MVPEIFNLLRQTTKPPNRAKNSQTSRDWFGSHVRTRPGPRAKIPAAPEKHHPCRGRTDRSWGEKKKNPRPLRRANQPGCPEPNSESVPQPARPTKPLCEISVHPPLRLQETQERERRKALRPWLPAALGPGASPLLCGAIIPRLLHRIPSELRS